MDILILYRGIAVPEATVENVRQKIISNGISVPDNATWDMEAVDLRDNLEELFNKEGLSTKDTRPSRWIDTDGGGYRELIGRFPVICACGDELGASYYASKHNKTADNNSPLIIKFQTSINNVQIDGKDFLCNPAFQRGFSKKQSKIVIDCFGSSIGKYLDKARKSKEQDFKIAMCDLAAQDVKVIKGHYKNQITIGGRHGTVFRSAFVVRVPVESEDIIDVYKPEYFVFSPDLTIQEFMSN